MGIDFWEVGESFSFTSVLLLLLSFPLSLFLSPLLHASFFSLYPLSLYLSLFSFAPCIYQRAFFSLSFLVWEAVFVKGVVMELRVGTKYRIGRKIGCGSFGDIYIGKKNGSSWGLMRTCNENRKGMARRERNKGRQEEQRTGMLRNASFSVSLLFLSFLLFLRVPACLPRNISSALVTSVSMCSTLERTKKERVRKAVRKGVRLLSRSIFCFFFFCFFFFFSFFLCLSFFLSLLVIFS